MVWLIAWGIIAAVIGAAWRIDCALRQRRSDQPVKDNAYRAPYISDDWFVDAKSYRRPAAGAGGGGGFFSDNGALRR